MLDQLSSRQKQVILAFVFGVLTVIFITAVTR